MESITILLFFFLRVTNTSMAIDHLRDSIVWLKKMRIDVNKRIRDAETALATLESSANSELAPPSVFIPADVIRLIMAHVPLLSLFLLMRANKQFYNVIWGLLKVENVLSRLWNANCNPDDRLVILRRDVELKSLWNREFQFRELRECGGVDHSTDEFVVFDMDGVLHILRKIDDTVRFYRGPLVVQHIVRKPRPTSGSLLDAFPPGGPSKWTPLLPGDRFIARYANILWNGQSMELAPVAVLVDDITKAIQPVSPFYYAEAATRLLGPDAYGQFKHQCLNNEPPIPPKAAAQPKGRKRKV